jgi:hypothetical protein
MMDIYTLKPISVLNTTSYSHFSRTARLNIFSFIEGIFV